jgi:non-canonical purine NTP pyrophosphatase (RdgB/HAM1 family)
MLQFITGNEKKLAEISALLPDVKGLNIDLPEIQEIDAHKIIQAKIQAAFEHQEGEFIVEDTSLYLDCMNGLPGPLIKWFLQTIGNQGLYKIVQAYGHDKATAKTIIGYAKSPGDVHFFEGEVRGTVVEPGAKETFGWDQIFVPDGYKKRYSEMTMEEKNSCSMRKLAAVQLKQFLTGK